jgi:arabinofuranan 3-O-arabinosyltransferase
LGAFGLLAALRLGPIAAVGGSLVYVLNPYVVSEVNTYAVYMAAMGLLAALPAALIAVGTRRIPFMWGAALIALASPMLGYVFFNPPLVGMILAGMLAAPLVAAWLEGKQAGYRSFYALLVGGTLLLASSAYWIIPAILHLSDFGGSQIVSLSSWTWTEGRATLRNAFWLNAIWGWNLREYYPYAPAYDSPILRVAAFALPATAFSALALPTASWSRCTKEARIAVAAATLALPVILISTGTNAPGNIIFDRLYMLPFGWLIREPGRFLMVGALSYAVLIGGLVEAFRRQAQTGYRGALQLTLGLSLPNLGLATSARGHSLSAMRLAARSLRSSFVPAVGLVGAIMLGFPLYTGAVVPDTRPSLPPVHVKVPGYWTEMGRFVDGLTMQGGVIVMPPDDFYQMPYRWGYYGTDSFVVDMFRRPVLIPNGQGYSPASSQVISAVNLAAHSIADRDWYQTEAIVRALNAPLILVRSDIESPYPGRSILSPTELAASLASAPNFTLLRQIGSLELFSLTGATSDMVLGASFATINTPTPDLRLLDIIPVNEALVTSESQVGVPDIAQAPPIEFWSSSGQALIWQPQSPQGRTYRIADLDSKTVVSLEPSETLRRGISSAQVDYQPDEANVVSVSLPARSVVTNGDFGSGLWGPVADCHAMNAQQARLNASVIANGAPGGQAALRLSASVDAACESQVLAWHSGPLVMSLMIRPIVGAPPRICLWEFGPDRCASLPAIPYEAGWSTYRGSIQPDPGTKAVSLYLYADEGAARSQTVTEYASVRVLEVPALPTLALLSDPGPRPISTIQLALVHSSYSNLWQGSVSGRHVVVDGMFNGWLIPSGVRKFSANYTLGSVFIAAQWISATTLLVVILLLLGPMAIRRGRRYLAE